MKVWRIIRAGLFVLFTIICLIAGFIDFKYGGASNKAMYICFVIGVILVGPGMVKDIASPYKGKKEPKKFVLRRWIFNTVMATVLSVGIYCLLSLRPDALEALQDQTGVDHRWFPLALFGIIMTCYLVIELLMFYLPYRLGIVEMAETEEEELKNRKVAAKVTAVIIIFASCLFIAWYFIPGLKDYISSDMITLIAAVLITIGLFLYLRKETKKEK